MVSKEVLKQFSDIKKEIVEVESKIDSLEKYIAKVEAEGSVIDTVTGGNGGIQHFKIEGFPYPEYSKKKTLLLTRKSILEQLRVELLEQENAVESFITTVDSSFMRRIIRMRFLENMTWNQIADKMGGNNTEDSVRMAFKRFMGEK